MADETKTDQEQAAPGASVDEARPPHVEDAEDRLMDVYLEDGDKLPRQIAIIATCFLFMFVLYATLPKGEGPEVPEMTIYVPDLDTYVPPMKEQPKIERKELEDVKKVPLPDPTPDEPEPIREPIPEPTPEPPPVNARVLRGLPKGPPMRSSGPVREGMAGLTSPQVVKNVEPDYPVIAKRAGVGGQVVIRAVIGRDGTVKSAELLKGLGQFGMDEAALEAVKRRVYTPGKLEGKPVEVIMTIRVIYSLD